HPPSPEIVLTDPLRQGLAQAVRGIRGEREHDVLAGAQVLEDPLQKPARPWKVPPVDFHCPTLAPSRPNARADPEAIGPARPRGRSPGGPPSGAPARG